MNGFLNLLKPPGMTSSNAVVHVRRTAQGHKVGHAGTLDPEVAGVLPIMVGKASRLFDVLAEKEKEYIAEIAFGVSTDTQDAQGTVVSRSGCIPSAEAVRAVLSQFTGDIMQRPPAFSALKIGGKPAYALARKGQPPEIAPRAVRVMELALLEQVEDNGMMLHVRCGKGVYVRTLCHDIGMLLGCPAHMRFLLRTRSGFFALQDAVTLEMWNEDQNRQAHLLPMDAPLAHLPSVVVSARYAQQIRSGQPIRDVQDAQGDVTNGQLLRLYCGDAFAGLARWKTDAFWVKAMLMD